MGKKGVEDMISELEIFIDNCKFSPLSSNKILVPKDEIGSMLNELRLKLPSEIDRSKKIMRNKEAILTDARSRADALLQEAGEEADRRVSQSQIVELANIQANEIIQMAQQQAAEIIKSARNEENELRLGAMMYTKSQLDNIKKYIASTLEAEKTNYEHLVASLENDSFVVNTNADEIDNQIRLMQSGASVGDKETEQTTPSGGAETAIPKIGSPVSEEPIMPGVTPAQREAQAVVAEALSQHAAVSQPQATGPVSQPQATGPVSQLQATGPVSQPQATGPVSQPQATGPVSQPQAAGSVGQPQAAGSVGQMQQQAAASMSQMQQQAAVSMGQMQQQVANPMSQPQPAAPGVTQPRSLGTVVDGGSQEPLW